MRQQKKRPKYNKVTTKSTKKQLNTNLIFEFCEQFPKFCMGIIVGVIICATTTKTSNEFLNCVQKQTKKELNNEFIQVKEINQTK